MDEEERVKLKKKKTKKICKKDGMVRSERIGIIVRGKEEKNKEGAI